VNDRPEQGRRRPDLDCFFRSLTTVKSQTSHALRRLRTLAPELDTLLREQTEVRS
jgi:hypothetical protein